MPALRGTPPDSTYSTSPRSDRYRGYVRHTNHQLTAYRLLMWKTPNPISHDGFQFHVHPLIVDGGVPFFLLFSFLSYRRLPLADRSIVRALFTILNGLAQSDGCLVGLFICVRTHRLDDGRCFLVLWSLEWLIG